MKSWTTSGRAKEEKAPVWASSLQRRFQIYRWTNEGKLKLWLKITHPLVSMIWWLMLYAHLTWQSGLGVRVILSTGLKSHIKASSLCSSSQGSGICLVWLLLFIRNYSGRLLALCFAASQAWPSLTRCSQRAPTHSQPPWPIWSYRQNSTSASLWAGTLPPLIIIIVLWL